MPTYNLETLNTPVLPVLKHNDKVTFTVRGKEFKARIATRHVEIADDGNTAPFVLLGLTDIKDIREFASYIYENKVRRGTGWPEPDSDDADVISACLTKLMRVLMDPAKVEDVIANWKAGYEAQKAKKLAALQEKVIGMHKGTMRVVKYFQDNPGSFGCNRADAVKLMGKLCGGPLEELIAEA